jgi:hypothetical protein
MGRIAQNGGIESQPHSFTLNKLVSETGLVLSNVQATVREVQTLVLRGSCAR